ncbi:unnamed protein product [Amoebophrya sp. A120]|nr:unnamed protein product [Amoebophrya sp. A120]|eukprot:GSA120T00001607001.1
MYCAPYHRKLLIPNLRKNTNLRYDNLSGPAVSCRSGDMIQQTNKPSVAERAWAHDNPSARYCSTSLIPLV